MRQYNEIKTKHPQALLLFRVGDFYETFGEDAVKTSRILGIVLTKRANGAAAKIELAGFPHHALDAYLPKLVRAGERVAICDQLEDPKKTKTIVKRGITELVTPGLTTNDKVLQSTKNNYLCAVHFTSTKQGIAFCDISTGDLFVAEGNYEYLEKLMQSFQPAEVIYNKQKRNTFQELFTGVSYSFALDEWIFKEDFAKESLLEHFQTKSLKGFGIENMTAAVTACGAIFHYMKETQHHRLEHISGVSRIDLADYVWMDRFTIRNLELFAPNVPSGKSLIDVINFTQSPMGARNLQRWLAMPLLKKEEIEERHNMVEDFYKNVPLSKALGDILTSIHDLERLAVKLSTRKVLPKELVQLKLAITAGNALKEKCSTSGESLKELTQKLHSLYDLVALIADRLMDEPSNQINKGTVIRDGVSDELDELRDLLGNGKNKLIEIQKREAQSTGISSLKVAFNNVFGYYLEVKNTHKDKVPDNWVRKQTLVNAERYITEELKEYEQKIFGAEEKILAIEQSLFENTVEQAAQFVSKLQQNAKIIAQVDCLLGFGLLARKQNYARPEINDGLALEVAQGRHPVIESSLPPGDEYVANDTHLNSESEQILMITGPNMSGKSALLRQTALISLLAQIGSFVPAKAANLGLVDKIFVRVGASDNISQGESTFMVEMNETASILNNLSARSLVILDEIGRGTSTYDGISLAWSIAEFIHQHPAKAKTLFATHYHELNEMEHSFERIHNFNVSVKELGGKIIFMRKLVAGGSAHSFGIHVAKMAGMPGLVLNKAQKILEDLERSRTKQDKNGRKKATDEMQLSFFKLDDPILADIKEDIRTLDINTLTPIEAMMKLHEIKKKIGA
jgi:DNA mismatch repair protein MutS